MTAAAACAPGVVRWDDPAMTDDLLSAVNHAVLDVVARTLTYAEYECIDCAAARWAALDAGIVECSICGLTLDLGEIALPVMPHIDARRRLLVMPDLTG